MTPQKEAREPRTVSQIPKRPTKPSGAWTDALEVFDCVIRGLRHKHGLTLREVAKYTGVSTATIGRIEAGAECQLSHALKLAHFFETTVEAIWKRKAVTRG